ncbi:tribbles homolog 3 [Pseudonaja textilis]|uniref:Tribbles pseudokinase 3 n=1 Tax=Pseudonaja textilis TaxID=8673 RepID=A0A670ZFQ1_PSETE|nr:tribbles homolog 3 [Pseudonaja textilis]
MSLLAPKPSAEAHVPKRRPCCEKASKAGGPAPKRPRVEKLPGPSRCLQPLPQCPPATDEGLTITQIGPYILLEPTEGGCTYRAVNRHTEAELTCKVYPAKSYPEVMAPYAALPSHPNIARVAEVIVGDQNVYVFFESGKDNMHDLVRRCKRVPESEAVALFRQMAEAIAHCHQHGIVLRDIKLKKFVFTDRERSKLLLENLEDAQVLMGSDDALMDKHGCPAYVGPEILSCKGSYSGKAADIWSLGVALYTLLVGCYPFQGTKPVLLFGKICRGRFTVPGDLSPKAQCLIRCLLRRDPAERLTASEILLHPWLASNPVPKALGVSPLGGQGLEQVVPEMGSCRKNSDKLQEVET